MAGLLEPKLKQFAEALLTLQELDLTQADQVVRDAAIQRFEYTVEAFWKLLKTYLAEKEALETYSPKEVMREARNAGLLSDPQLKLALSMIEDRNNSTHLYGLAMADKIYSRLKSYTDFMSAVGDLIK